MELKELISGIVRHVLTLAGGVLVSNGQIDPSQSETLIGAAMAIFGVVWSVLAKRKAKEAASVEEVKE